MVEDIHKENCRAGNSGEFALIKSGQRDVEAAERGMAHVVGISHGLTERPASVVLRLALATGHDRAAGLMSDAETVAATRNLMAAEQRRAA